MPRLEMVPTGRLKVDPSYQRALQEQRVQRMAGAWSDDLAQALVVSARGGSFYVIDGQHRLAAARLASIAMVPAIIHEDLAPADEANLFVLLNTTRIRPPANEVFRARLEGQDAKALEIKRAADEADVLIDLANSGGRSTNPRSTRAIGALLAIHKQGGAELVRQTLGALRAAWPEDRHALDAVAVYGVASFIEVYRLHPRYDYSRLARKLGEVSATVFLRRANQYSQTDVSGGAVDQGARMQKAGPRRAVLEAFNRGLRGERLPDATLRDFRKLREGRNPWVEQ